MNKIVNINIDTPIDVKMAAEGLGGNMAIFFQMLSQLEKLSLNPSLTDIADAVSESDWLKVKNKVHGLKGASGYIGAGQVHYSCYNIQD